MINDYHDTPSPRSVRAERVGLFTSSADYYAALDRLIPRVQHHILIVGWSFDDRVILRRPTADSDEYPSVGERLLALARNNPRVEIDLRIWDAPSVFPADQYISNDFVRSVETVPNLSLRRIPSRSAFNSRHEKYVILDGCLAFLGGMDISHNRWDGPDHAATDQRRVNPDGHTYQPYHDTQLALTGPIVTALYETAAADGLVDGSAVSTTAAPPNAPAPLQPAPPGAPAPLWPTGLAVLARDIPVTLVHTRDTTDGSVRQIEQTYVDMIRSAEHTIYIENQYFAGEAVTDALLQQIQREDGPEVIIVISRELPDAVGRITMGLNSAQHLSILRDHDRHGKLGVFNPVAPDDPSVAVKVHSKTMIVDDRLVTIGSANISDRSFRFDAETNVTFEAEAGGEASVAARHEAVDEAVDEAGDAPDDAADDADAGPRDGPAGAPDNARAPFPREITDTLLARHAGVSLDQWRQAVAEHGGSRLAALTERSRTWSGLVTDSSHRSAPPIPPRILDRFDMDHPPPQETVLTRLLRSDPARFLARLARRWLTVVLVAAAIGGLVFLSQRGIDVDRVLQFVREIRDTRPLLAAALTILSYWLAISLFVTIVVPIVAFAALYGSWWGILYSTIGIFSGAAIFYAVGRGLYNSAWLNRFRAIKMAKRQLEKIRPYGTWAVAISRMVPSGPFMVVNLVTGMVGFVPSQFLVGSAIGLFPGIIAFSFFGDIIRAMFTDPSLINTAWFILFVVAYTAFARLILALVRRVAGWKSGTETDTGSGTGASNGPGTDAGTKTTDTGR